MAWVMKRAAIFSCVCEYGSPFILTNEMVFRRILYTGMKGDKVFERNG